MTPIFLMTLMTPIRRKMADSWLKPKKLGPSCEKRNVHVVSLHRQINRKSENPVSETRFSLVTKSFAKDIISTGGCRTS